MFAFICSPETCLLPYTIWPCGIKYLDSAVGQPMSIPGSWGCISGPSSTSTASLPISGQRGSIPSFPYRSFMVQGNDDYLLYGRYLSAPLLIHASRRFEVGHTTDDMKEVIRHMAGESIDFHDLD